MPSSSPLIVLLTGAAHGPTCVRRMIEAFEAVAARTVTLGPRESAPLGRLIHPVFATGHVWAWEVLTGTAMVRKPAPSGGGTPAPG